MNTLIVYYSLEGNTEFAAQKVALMTGADTYEIKPLKEIPKKGFKKFFWGGKSAIMAEAPEIEPHDFDMADYDRIIFGFPVWAGNFTPPIRTFIKENDLSGKTIAAFACQSGVGAEKALSKLKDALGISQFAAEMILIDPKARPSKENELKIKEFCEKLNAL